ncbi:MAG: glycosyltransferase [Erythrobacteraceae bacterium]|nr:glycosyltransferase [Erythrobacteraceae bacterium]
MSDTKLIRPTPDEVATFRASGAIDEAWYLNEYADVAQCGIDPTTHYLWLGRALGRRSLPSPGYLSRRETDHAVATNQHAGSANAGANLDALFIDGTNGTSSTPYRVFRIANGLAQEGWHVRCAKGEDLLTLMQEDLRPRFAIFHRAPYWSPFTDFVDQLRAKGAIIVYDIDDLVFDESVIPFIDGYRLLPDDAKQGFLNGLRAYRNFIVNADMCTSTTGFLVDEIRKLGTPTFRVRNAISVENIGSFEEIDYKRSGRPSPFVVGYYSGTKTHQADFAVAAPALIQFMHENVDVVFRIIGDFDLNDWPELAHWQHIHRPGDMPRVIKVGLMPHDVMIRDQFSCDIILAPLEVGNPFCEAKSELKFFEASLAQTPVIASATRTFSEACDHGRLADLAVTTEDWLNALRSIYGSYRVALSRSRAAYDHVRYVYSQRYAANEALEAYEEFAARLSGATPASLEATAARVADVAVVLPDVSGPSGGHRKIFAVCRALVEAGLSVKLYFYSSRSPKAIERDLDRFFGKMDIEISCFVGSVDQHNFAICTQWKTAYDFRNVPFEGKVIYFVQDFEPMFHAVGSNYMRAIVSYRLDYQIICYGNWVAAQLADDLGVSTAAIPFTLDHTIYKPPVVERERDIDVLVFARPSQDRRCLDIIVEGLRYLKQRKPAVRIAFFGEDEYPDFGFAFDNLGSFSDLGELAALYQRTAVGICYSPTNPSQLGYEMLACGACLIDVRVKFSELNFGGEAFVRYCDGTPEDMSDACEALLADPQERKRRQGLGYEFVRAMPNDEELGRAFIEAAGVA